jgi:hypothetical protein
MVWLVIVALAFFVGALVDIVLVAGRSEPRWLNEPKQRPS